MLSGLYLRSVAFIVIVLLLICLDCLSFNIGGFGVLCVIVRADVLLLGVGLFLVCPVMP